MLGLQAPDVIRMDSEEDSGALIRLQVDYVTGDRADAAALQSARKHGLCGPTARLREELHA